MYNAMELLIEDDEIMTQCVSQQNDAVVEDIPKEVNISNASHKSLEQLQDNEIFDNKINKIEADDSLPLGNLIQKSTKATIELKVNNVLS